MEQLNYIKDKLSIPHFKPLKVEPLPPFESYHLILIITSFSLILSMICDSNFAIYIGTGFVLPIFLLGKEEVFKLKDYWIWLSILLLTRDIIQFASAFDVLYG